jgi:hypothetical protein
MENQKIDQGNNTVVANPEAEDNRHKANGLAAEIVKAVLKAETALATTAKDWGHSLFRSVIIDKVSLDTLIGESKLAAGFATLGASEAGRKAKQRLNVYFSNARLVSERYSTLSEETQNAILNGETSIHYLASQFRDADRKALSEAKKAEAAAEAAASGVDMTDGESQPVETLKTMAEALLAAWTDPARSDDERADAYDTIAALVAAVDASIEADAKADESGEAEKIAA